MIVLRRRVVWFLALAVLPAAGCDDSTGVPEFHYRAVTTPENVVLNLQDAYRRRESEPYAKLLAPEFRFVFQPQDAINLGQETLNRDEDIAGTTALLTTAQVAAIRILLTLANPVAAADTTLPADAVRIRANQVQLQVDETAGISWVVTDVQDFFLRPGRPADGENATDWYLLEWRDLPTVVLHPRILPSEQEVTWGLLKTWYATSPG